MFKLGHVGPRIVCNSKTGFVCIKRGRGPRDYNAWFSLLTLMHKTLILPTPSWTVGTFFVVLHNHMSVISFVMRAVTRNVFIVIYFVDRLDSFERSSNCIHYTVLNCHKRMRFVVAWVKLRSESRFHYRLVASLLQVPVTLQLIRCHLFRMVGRLCGQSVTSCRLPGIKTCQSDAYHVPNKSTNVMHDWSADQHM